ncbi:MAG: cell division protein ZapA [Bryobacterales bacterium]|nr:cell division protein ZapA [Bryobacteraceae bacterium]MDW8132004.1 cell division protein ZapA [Bryobacterales bacterium]
MPGEAGQKHPVRVTILDQTYTVLAAGDEREVLELADAVNQLMAAIAARFPKADDLRVAVLACLHLADRLRALERELEEFRRRVEHKSRTFGLLLDEMIRSEQGA